MRNVVDKAVEKIKTRFTFKDLFFWKSCHFLDNVENMVQLDRPQMTIQ